MLKGLRLLRVSGFFITKMNTGQIIRSKLTQEFTILPNKILQGELTIEEAGLLGFLLSMPLYWVFYKKDIYNRLKQDKKGTIDRVFKQLREKGYISSVKVVNELGQFSGWNHVVYDSPRLDLPTSEITDLGENAPIQKTNTINKVITNTKRENLKINFSHPNNLPDSVRRHRESVNYLTPYERLNKVTQLLEEHSKNGLELSEDNLKMYKSVDNWISLIEAIRDTKRESIIEFTSLKVKPCYEAYLNLLEAVGEKEFTNVANKLIKLRREFNKEDFPAHPAGLANNWSKYIKIIKSYE